MTDGNTMLIENSGGNTIQRGLIKIIIMPFKNISIFFAVVPSHIPTEIIITLIITKTDHISSQNLRSIKGVNCKKLKILSIIIVITKLTNHH